ncbi:MAG TPA: PDZ domain-containing protein [Chthoniobacterales bacterium]|nr:PDZ domain-containing protein [Chthoniobacterales bacterium]
MKTKTIAVIAALGLLPAISFAQPPPAPPNPPNPPNSPIPPVPPNPPKDRDHERDKGPKIPVTFLGVETSEVPRVVCEQLGLAKGFGLVVDYVVPDGPAAAAGVQQSDILKMLNDQILMQPDQLAKLVRSYSEGTSITLTILRKGAESKVTVKLGKREVSSRNNFFGPDPGRDRHRHDKDMGFNYQFNMPDMSAMESLKDEMGNLNIGPMIHDAVKDARREAMRARAEALKAARQVRVMTSDAAAKRSTTIDLDKAVIVSTDPQGELKIEKANGKRMLTAKDPQGRLLFSGPVDSKEELDKVPADVRQRYEKLEHKDLPGVLPFASNNKSEEMDDEDNDNDNDNDNDSDDNDNDDEDGPSADASMQQVSFQAFPRSFRLLNAVSL